MVDKYPQNSSVISAFELLHPKIQQQLYTMGWTKLRPIQIDSIREITLKNDSNLVISAQTASGKTEAAFLPILSLILDNFEGSVRALYISPLKALINDQFRRLEDLCERAEIPVHRWHGDVSQSVKNTLIRNPSGVLLITPESTESLFINRPQQLTRLFSELMFIVVDEIHSFIGTERGAHLKSLISRILPRSNKVVRLVGLSATLGDMNMACQWLCSEENRIPVLITDDTEEKVIRFMIHGYLRKKHENTGCHQELGHKKHLNLSPDVTSSDEALANDILKAFSNKTSLIFANNKAKLEFYADIVKRKAEAAKIPHSFLVHHGSLSKAERECTEEELRSGRPAAVFCSSTLELGIDVGNVSIVGQIGPPWSVNSLIQRLGRSGRHEDQPSVTRMFVQEYEPDKSTPLTKRLYPGFIQGIAMTELMLEKWCEPPEPDRMHVSTLVHQILSLIAEAGGASAQNLYQTFVAKGPFSNIDQKMFIQLIRSLGEKEILEQMPEGDLILGIEGERIVRRFDFYPAFQVDEEIAVIYSGRGIGSVLGSPDLGADGFLILAGRRWKIIEIDWTRREIIVEPAKGGRLPFFSERHGPDVHARIRQKMRDVLLSEHIPSYIDEQGKALLLYARHTARDAGLHELSFIREGNTEYWFTWTSSRINRTLMGLGLFFTDLNVTDDLVALTFRDVSRKDISEKFKGFLSKCPSPADLASNFPSLQREKFDPYISEGILINVFAHNCLDLNGAIQLIEKM